MIDCGSYIANDILSAVALMEADSVLRLANADLKSISYLSSQLPLLKDAKWDTDKQYKIAANVKPQQAGSRLDRRWAMWPSYCPTLRNWRPSSSQAFFSPT